MQRDSTLRSLRPLTYLLLTGLFAVSGAACGTDDDGPVRLVSEDAGDTSSSDAGSPPGPSVDPEVIDELVVDEMIRQQIAGLAVGIVEDGEVVYTQGYGFADYEDERPVTDETMIRWASISKPLTTMAAMRMVEEGDLALSAGIDSYVDDLSEDKAAITMEDLLANEAGIPHYSEYEGSWYAATEEHYYDESVDRDPWNGAAALDIVVDQPLLFEPGEFYHYTTFGFNLAGSVIDYAARDTYGTGYVELIEDEIAGPLEMDSLQPDYEFETIDERVAGYERGCFGEMRDENTDKIAWKLPGGGWMSTVDDMTRFMQALMDDRVLSDESRELMMTRRHAPVYDPYNPDPDEAREAYYGLGLSSVSSGDNKQVWHSGSQTEAATYMRFYPNTGLGVVLMSNTRHLDRLRLWEILVDAFGTSRDINEYSFYEEFDCHLDSGAGSCANQSLGTNFSGIWREGDREHVIRRELSRDDLEREVAWMGEQGYAIADLESYGARDDRKWDAVFRKQEADVEFRLGLTTADFEDERAELADEGYELVDVDASYEHENDEIVWIGIFTEGSEEHVWTHGLTDEEVDDEWASLEEAGYRPVDIERYIEDDTPHWAAVWREGEADGDIVIMRDADDEAFDEQREQLRDDGKRLVDLEAYPGSGARNRWAAVWHGARDGDVTLRSGRFCDLIEEYDRGLAEGRELVDLERR